MPEFKKDENEIGALWLKSSARGDYFTGTVNNQPIVVFKNDKKREGSKAPDYRIMKPRPKADAVPRPADGPPEVFRTDDDDSIPF